jgi:hypothetical protein
MDNFAAENLNENNNEQHVEVINPCKCGSLTHRTTKSKKCPLNKDNVKITTTINNVNV